MCARRFINETGIRNRFLELSGGISQPEEVTKLGCLQHFRRVTGPEFSLKAGTASPHRKYLHI